MEHLEASRDTSNPLGPLLKGIQVYKSYPKPESLQLMPALGYLDSCLKDQGTKYVGL